MSAVLTQAALPNPWRQALPALLAVVVALLLLYRDSFGAMAGIWSRSDTFAHAFLVPPIVLWLAWRQRDVLASITPRPQPWFLLPMAAAAALWLLGDMAGVNALTQLAATALLVLAVPAVLGTAVAREVAFPLGFLFFMVPIGEFALPMLMEWTADFTVAALQMTGVPVFREGLNFVIPSGSWSVVEACSGVRYLIASFMVGTLFAYLNYRSTTRRLIFAGVSILVPVIANWVRAYMIVMIGHLSSNQLATGVDHLVYGWVFFGVVILLMFFIGARWSEPQATPGSSGADSPRAAGLPATGSPGSAWVWGAAVVLLAALPQSTHWLPQAPAAPVVLALPELPGLAPPGAGGGALLTPLFGGAATMASRTYGAGPDAVTVHVAYYRGQGYGRKLVSSENVLVRTQDTRWLRAGSGVRDLEVAGRKTRFVTTELLSPRGLNDEERPRLDVRQVYWVDGQLTASDSWATALGVLGRLGGRGDDAAAITVYTAGAARSGTSERLDRFTRQHLPAIQAALAAARSSR